MSICTVIAISTNSPHHERDESIEVKLASMFTVKIRGCLTIELNSRLFNNHKVVLLNCPENVLECDGIGDRMRFNHRECEHDFDDFD